MKTFIVSERQSFMKLLCDLSETTAAIISPRGIDSSWLSFARPVEYGYKLSLWKDRQWELLGSIVESVLKRNRKYTKGEVSEILCMLVNNTVKEYMDKKSIGIQLPLKIDMESHLQSPLIDIVCSSQYIPRYPWLLARQAIDEYNWTAYDVSLDTLLTVRKRKKKEFIQYELQYKEAPNHIFI